MQMQIHEDTKCGTKTTIFIELQTLRCLNWWENWKARVEILVASLTDQVTS